MRYCYSIIQAGERSDFSPFWKQFDNYMLKSSQYEYLDEQMLGWYLTDGYHEAFYEKLFQSPATTKLLLFYRERRDLSIVRSKHLLERIFERQNKEARTVLREQRTEYRSGNGTCVGFCILEQDRATDSKAWILALGLDGLDGENQEKLQLWKMAEEKLKRMGIYTLETTSYQDLNFWAASGFRSVNKHMIRKSL